jgi:hypothetical protein
LGITKDTPSLALYDEKEKPKTALSVMHGEGYLSLFDSYGNAKFFK